MPSITQILFALAFGEEEKTICPPLIPNKQWIIIYYHQVDSKRVESAISLVVGLPIRSQLDSKQYSYASEKHNICKFNCYNKQI